MTEKQKHVAQPEELPGVRNGIIPHDDEFAALYPTLHRLMMPKYDELGRPTREGGYISIKIVSSLFHVTLSLTTEKRQTTLNTDLLMDLYEQLEQYLSCGKAVWELTWKERKIALTRLEKTL